MSKSQIMKRAGQLRVDGYDASEALSQAWSEEGSETTSFQPNWLLILIAGYFGWVLAKYTQTKVWDFTPWTSIGRFNRLKQLPRPVIRQPADKSHEQASLITTTGIVPTRPGSPFEQVKLIMP